MYGGLLVLVVWRSLCFYRCCGVWLSVLNPASLLYALLVALLVYSLVSFSRLMQVPLDASMEGGLGGLGLWSVPWLRTFVLLSPVAICITTVMCWFHTEGHVFEIHKDLARRVKHDRAVQIIALPAVFGVMALASMVPVLELVTGSVDSAALSTPFGMDLSNVPFHWAAGQAAILGAPVVALDAEQKLRLALWRYETCFYVADLFEAWALYQFGKLALEIIGDSFAKRESMQGPECHPSGVDATSMQDLLASHAAVTSLTWLGMVTFVVVCVAQTAFSLWPYLGGSQEDTRTIMLHFQVAGFVASSAAIYNVYVVERAFHRHLAACSPVLKFMTVKILVSLSFFQRGLLVVLHACNQNLPEVVKRVVSLVPLVGDIVNLTEVQLHLFYPALILFECLLTATMHLWAWSSEEVWYDPELENPELEPLLAAGWPQKEGAPQGV